MLTLSKTCNRYNGLTLHKIVSMKIIEKKRDQLISSQSCILQLMIKI